MGELGWLGMPVPQQYGGSEVDALTAAVLVEELGYHWASLGSDFVLVSMAARLVSGFGSEESRSACRDAGFDAYLAKPVDSSALVASIRNALRARRKAS